MPGINGGNDKDCKDSTKHQDAVMSHHSSSFSCVDLPRT
jgi:hypothetical protein